MNFLQKCWYCDNTTDVIGQTGLLKGIKLFTFPVDAFRQFTHALNHHAEVSQTKMVIGYKKSAE